MNFNEENSPQNDVFDLLPDALVLEIFNRVQDAKSLSTCMSLCKRFELLIPQTDKVRLIISRQNNHRNAKPASNSKPSKGFLRRVIFKPIKTCLQRIVTKKPKRCSHCDEDEDEDDLSFSMPNDMLKNFNEIQSLNVQLPSHEGYISSNSRGAFLKWTAEFGKELENCVVLGATRLDKSPMCQKTKEVPNNLTRKQLKKRVVWTISCLIAASARHHMLKQIVLTNRLIRDVEISDGSKQGKIRMEESQIVELRQEMDSVVDGKSEIERTKIPALTIKMWYVPVLELPESGCVMKGATLAVIRPATAVAEKDDVSFARGAFGEGEEEKWFGEAARKLITKKAAYTLEMNSF